MSRSDASTSTDDIKSRPLCLFYFTHPFGVLSPEPPTIAVSPPNIARTFINMEPVSSFDFWTTSTPEYNTSTTSSMRSEYELGNGKVHKKPLNLVNVRPTKYIDFSFKQNSASSLFCNDWHNSSSSSKSYDLEYNRRMIPYNRILPPLQLAPQEFDDKDVSSDNFWVNKRLKTDKFFLPPIEINKPSISYNVQDKRTVSKVDSSSVDSFSIRRMKCTGAKRTRGVKKMLQRRRLGNVRRSLTFLIERIITLTGNKDVGGTPSLQEALNTIREAWTEPKSLKERCRALGQTSDIHEVESSNDWEYQKEEQETNMVKRSQLTNMSVRADASPGLLRRRYSVPETVMRKYRLAAEQAESDDLGDCEGVTTNCGSPGGGSGGRGSSCSLCDSVNAGPRRESMRRGAILRRLWGRDVQSNTTCCRSLDGSRSDLRSPKRQRLYCSPPRHLHTPLIDRTSRSMHRSDIDVFSKYEQLASSDESKLNIVDRNLAQNKSPCVNNSSSSTTGSSFISSSSMPTTVEADNIRNEMKNNSKNITYYSTPLKVETPAYEVLEVIISENSNGNPNPNNRIGRNYMNDNRMLNSKILPDINIDEYVSNILVESLNSLTDQIDNMNASIGIDKKVSIIEKEIKVKLQNTGVNTIVHLSPTSNNQIIFGNEELYDSDDIRDNCNNLQSCHDVTIRGEIHCLESNNNISSADTFQDKNSLGKELEVCSTVQYDKVDKNILELNNINISDQDYESLFQNDNINKTVLHQIQKLFQDELQTMDPEMSYSMSSIPNISHIEISNVDVFIDNNINTLQLPDMINIETKSTNNELISGVTSGNYFLDVEENPIIPRFTAFPNSDSMEVNTSSSEDVDALGSECTSLVDSLDDPNSPRSVLLRRSYNNIKRNELVRSAIDILDLLPESSTAESAQTKEKGESFFIRIRGDSDCDCEKENIVVADHMPEKIKERLLRRNRKRELRMECARRSKMKQLKKELEKQKQNEISKSKKELEKECMAILNALVDDVMAKIIHDEYKYMRIKQKSLKVPNDKHNDINNKRYWRKNGIVDDNVLSKAKIPKNAINTDLQNCNRIQGKLSLQNHPSIAPEDRRSRRVYQKSEIREGNKCIEILEILEYVDSSRSSSGENENRSNGYNCSKTKKSRIPIPIQDKNTKNIEELSKSSTAEQKEQIINEIINDSHMQLNGAPRRASVPSGSPRSRSNSVRFRHVFDVIPEDSSGEECSTRRSSEPSLCLDLEPRLHRGTMTSPIRSRRSAATSPAPPMSLQATGLTDTGDVTDTQSSVHLSASKQIQCKSPIEKEKNKTLTKKTKDLFKHNSSTANVKKDKKIRDDTPVRTPLKSLNNKKEKHKSIAIDNKPMKRENIKSRDYGVHRSQEDVLDMEKSGSSSSSSSSGTTLCPLAPSRWLRRRRKLRNSDTSSPNSTNDKGSWSVTVAGRSKTSLPADVEMRLRFPQSQHQCDSYSHQQDSSCSRCRCSGCEHESQGSSERAPLLPSAHKNTLTAQAQRKLTLTMKKEATDSSILASKSRKKSYDALPNLETYRSERTKTKSSLKTRQGCSLHCWLPGDAPIRGNNGLSVLGSAIVPEIKPRVPTMSERDLTRLYTPRHYLRS